MNYFSDCIGIDAIKLRYRELAFKHHPDVVGGCTATMQAINSEYHNALKHGVKKGYTYARDAEQVIIDKLAELLTLRMELVRILLVGQWIWCEGETREHKEKLKELGLRWSANRAAWYFHNGKYKHRASSHDFETIKARYGASEIRGKQSVRISQ